MTTMRRIQKIWLFQMKQTLASRKTYAVLILIGIFTWSNAQQISDFASMVQIKAHPWVFPHIVNDFICQFVFAAACITLFSDAPWNTDLSSYLVVRSGKRTQCAGHIFYIASLSFCFIAYILIVSIVALLPNIEFADGWGKVLGTLARTDASSQIGLSFSISDYLIGAFTPVKATLLSVILEWACFTLLGLVTYILNSHLGKYVGICISAIIVLLDITIANEWTPFAYHFSPITLAQLTSFVGMNNRFGITLLYAGTFFISCISMLIIIILLLSRRKQS